MAQVHPAHDEQSNVFSGMVHPAGRRPPRPQSRVRAPGPGSRRHSLAAGEDRLEATSVRPARVARRRGCSRSRLAAQEPSATRSRGALTTEEVIMVQTRPGSPPGHWDGGRRGQGAGLKIQRWRFDSSPSHPSALVAQQEERLSVKQCRSGVRVPPGAPHSFDHGRTEGDGLSKPTRSHRRHSFVPPGVCGAVVSTRGCEPWIAGSIPARHPHVTTRRLDAGPRHVDSGRVHFTDAAAMDRSEQGYRSPKPRRQGSRSSIGRPGTGLWVRIPPARAPREPTPLRSLFVDATLEGTGDGSPTRLETGGAARLGVRFFYPPIDEARGTECHWGGCLAVYQEWAGSIPVGPVAGG